MPNPERGRAPGILGRAGTTGTPAGGGGAGRRRAGGWGRSGRRRCPERWRPGAAGCGVAHKGYYTQRKSARRRAGAGWNRHGRRRAGGVWCGLRGVEGGGGPRKRRRGPRRGAIFSLIPQRLQGCKIFFSDLQPAPPCRALVCCWDSCRPFCGPSCRPRRPRPGWALGGLQALLWPLPAAAGAVGPWISAQLFEYCGRLVVPGVVRGCPLSRINLSCRRTNAVRAASAHVKGFFLFSSPGYNFSPSISPNFPKYLYRQWVKQSKQGESSEKNLCPRRCKNLSSPT